MVVMLYVLHTIIHYHGDCHGDNIVSTLTMVLRSYIWLLGNYSQSQYNIEEDGKDVTLEYYVAMV